jgi:hypothetical protein
MFLSDKPWLNLYASERILQMPKAGWLRNLWNAIKGNVYYDVISRIVVFIWGSALLTTSWKSIQAYRGENKLDPLGLAILASLILCTFLLIWIASKHSGGVRSDLNPQFQFDVGTLLWVYDAGKKMTLFFPIARILNRGHSSIAANWNATYKISGHSEKMTALWLRDSYKLRLGEEELTIENCDLLPAKTAEIPVQRGGVASGRLLFTLVGDRTSQINSLQHSIDFSCEDYQGNLYTAHYKPSSEPVNILMTLPHERAVFKKSELAPTTSVLLNKELK